MGSDLTTPVDERTAGARASSRRSAPRLRLPAALLRLFAELPRDRLAAARAALPPRSGVHWLRDDLCAVLPVAADPGVGDVALQIAAELRRGLGDPPGLGLLVTPGRVDIHGDSVVMPPDTLQDDLDRRPPSLGPGVHLTARKARRLEFARQLTLAGTYRGPTVPAIPIFAAAGPVAPGQVPWRSAEMLRVSAPYVPRPGVDDTLAVLHEVPVALVQGGLGVGKTRAVHHALAGRRTLWVTLRPERHRGPTLGAQLAWSLASGGSEAALWARELGFDGSGRWLEPDGVPPQLGDAALMGHLLPGWLRRAPAGAPVVVCDGLESATAADGRLVALLARAAEAGWYRLVLVSRGSLPTAVAGGRWPVVEIPPLTATESEAHARGVSPDLELPEQLFERLLGHAAGCPFAFEEGLAALAELDRLEERGGRLRYHGPADGEFVPSDRFVRHVEAEVARLEDPSPLRLLALAEGAVPDDRLSAVVGRSRDPAECGEWVAGALAAGLVAEAESAWGPAVDVPFPAVRAALRWVVDAKSLRPWLTELHRELGIEESPAELLLTNPLEPVDPPEPLSEKIVENSGGALEAAREGMAPTAELVPALAAELSTERARGIDAETELLMLWTLLPMARRVGVLESYRHELVRALELAVRDPVKRFALAGLKSELDEQADRFEEAAETLRDALRSAAGATEQGRAVLLLRLGRVLIRLDRLDEASELLERVVPVLDAAGASSLAASGRFHLAEIARHHHQLDPARLLHLDALAVRRTIGTQKPIAASLSALGLVELRAGRTTEALERFREAEEIHRRMGDEQEVASALLGIGQAYARLGNYVGATVPMKRALEVQRNRGDEAGEALVRLHLGENLLDLGRPREALAEIRQARFGLELHSMRSALAHSEKLLGRIALAQQKPAEARLHFQAAREAHHALDDAEQVAMNLSWLLLLAVERESDEEVAALVRELKAAMAACPEAERRELLEFRLHLGLERLWRVSEARSHLERAYRSLLAKTEHLPVELRNRFLSQIPEHQRLVDAATRAGL